ncbi:hypothetical protein EG329_005980 [Mollisiaceae sp. DMI_Dod_QoI]|nr:hypothetical protein EG329_005980 [Helotiales sp. DMI_Dod_QoI]
MAAPNQPARAAPLIYAPYKSVKNQIVDMCRTAGIMKALAEQRVSQAKAYIQKQYPNEHHWWKMWKEEQLVFHRLFGDQKFPGVKPKVIKSQVPAPADTQSKPSGPSKQPELSPGTSSSPSGTSKVLVPANVYYEPASTSKQSGTTSTSSSVPNGNTQPPTQASRSIPTITKEERTKLDLESTAKLQKQAQDLATKTLEQQKTDALRAQNIGAPLLPLQHSLPQFSVVATFTLPNPDRSFAGRRNKHMKSVQAKLQVLLRYARIKGKFVVWVEPKKASQAKNPRMLDMCADVLGFLRFWESRQRRTPRSIFLNRHWKAWMEVGPILDGGVRRRLRDEGGLDGLEIDIDSIPRQTTTTSKPLPNPPTTDFPTRVPVPLICEENPAWVEAEGLASQLCAESGKVDSEAYKTRKMIYDTVGNTFMPLAEYEDLIRQRVLDEVIGEEKGGDKSLLRGDRRVSRKDSRDEYASRKRDRGECDGEDWYYDYCRSRSDAFRPSKKMRGLL